MIIFSRLKNFIFKISSAVFYKLGGKKKIFAMVLCLILIGVFCVVPLGVEANEWLETTASNFLIFIFQLFISVMGEILLLIVKILIAFCSYNDFADSTAVINGWVIVRDLVNMFFVVVLLVIAIATILKIESYSYKKMLGRLVLMAVLVNFSKTISLLFIDFAQVLMMTFVNGFQAAGGGNFVTALGLTKIFDFRTNLASENMNDFGVAGAYLLGLIMILISTVVVGMMLIILVMRTIVLWILIVLSPLAFFLSIIPQAKKYADQWWSMFTEYVLVGPILAFFLWLSLVSVTSLSPTDKPRFVDDTFKTQQNVGITEVGTQDNIISFIIAIGMLVGGLTMTGKMGVIGAGIGIGVLAGAKRMGMGAVKKTASWTAKKPFQAYALGARKLKTRTGLELNPVNLYKNMKEGFAAKKLKEEREGTRKAGERMEKGGVWGAVSGMGAAGWVENYAQGWFYKKGIKRALIGKSGRVKAREEMASKKEGEAKKIEEDWTNPRLAGRSDDITQRRERAFAQRRNFTTADGKEYTEDDLLTMAMEQGGVEPHSPEAEAWIKENFDNVLAKKELGQEFKGSDENKEAEVLRGEAKKYKQQSLEAAAYMPEDYLARAETRKVYHEAQQKWGHVTNEDQLFTAFQKATARGDKEEAGGVALQMAQVGNDNELLKRTVGRVDQEGFNQFTNEILIKQLKLSPQAAISLQNDISMIAKEKKHWNLAESVGQNLDGTFKQRTFHEQQKAVAGERSKDDFEDRWRKPNRLGICSEQVDPKTGEIVATLLPASVAEITRDFKKLSDSMEKRRFNTNSAMHMVMPQNMKILEQIKVSLPPSEHSDFDAFLKKLKKFAAMSKDEMKKGFGGMIENQIKEAERRIQAAGGRP